MNIRIFALKDSSSQRIGLSSIIFVAGFVGVVILPFYLYLFGAGIFWEYLGVMISMIFAWNFESYRLMRYGLKSKRIVSLPGYFEYRFGKNLRVTRIFSSVEIAVFSMVLAALLFKELAIILNVVTGVSQFSVLGIGVIVVCLYIGLIGINAIYKTVYIKAAFFILIILALCIFMYAVTGSDRLIRNLMSADVTGSVSEYISIIYHDGVPMRPQDYISLISMGLLAGGMPFLLGIFFGARSARKISYGRMFMVIYGAILFVLAAIMGGISRGYMYPARITTSLSQYINLQYKTVASFSSMGKVIGFLYIVMIVLGFVTTIEGAIHATITTIFDDILKNGNLVRLNPRKEKRNIILVTVFVGFITYSIGVFIKDMSINYIVLFIATLGCSISPTVIMSLYWKRMTSAGCMAGLVTGMLSVPYFRYADMVTLNGQQLSLCDALGINSILPSMILTIIMIIIVSLVTKEPEEKKLTTFEQVNNRMVD